MASFYVTQCLLGLELQQCLRYLSFLSRENNENINDEITEYLHASYMYKHCADCYTLYDCAECYTLYDCFHAKTSNEWLFT